MIETQKAHTNRRRNWFFWTIKTIKPGSAPTLASCSSSRNYYLPSKKLPTNDDYYFKLIEKRRRMIHTCGYTVSFRIAQVPVYFSPLSSFIVFYRLPYRVELTSIDVTFCDSRPEYLYTSSMRRGDLICSKTNWRANWTKQLSQRHRHLESVNYPL